MKWDPGPRAGWRSPEGSDIDSHSWQGPQGLDIQHQIKIRYSFYSPWYLPSGSRELRTITQILVIKFQNSCDHNNLIFIQYLLFSGYLEVICRLIISLPFSPLSLSITSLNLYKCNLYNLSKFSHL